MPPKEKVSRVDVSDMAFSMTREYGFKEVTARKLAQNLGCSTQPIFRAYENMEELREEIYYMSVQFFCDYILAKKSKVRPVYMTLALSYIELARKEKNLFELIASVDDFGTQTLSDFLKRKEWEDQLEQLVLPKKKSGDKKRELFEMYFMFVHGLASLIVSNRVSYTEKEIKELLEKAYNGFAGQI